MACRNVELAEKAKLELSKMCPEAQNKLFPMLCDINDSKSIAEFCKQFGEIHGKADVLVSNAGSATKGRNNMLIFVCKYLFNNKINLFIHI